MKKTAMTEILFKNIKTLIEHGVNRREIAELMGVSMSTVNRVAIHDSLEAMHESSRNWGKAPAPAAPEQVAPVTPAPVTGVPSAYQINRTIEQNKQIIELLTTISAKLAYIVEQLA